MMLQARALAQELRQAAAARAARRDRRPLLRIVSMYRNPAGITYVLVRNERPYQLTDAGWEWSEDDD
jgi:hypothetical protein